MRKQDITYQDKLNELRLDIIHPNSKNKVYVLLEGESDVRIFRKLFNTDNCKVENVPGGNPKLEECVRTLVGTHLLVIGIRDADFMHLSGTQYLEPNIFLTDLHDIEMMICANDNIFSAVISEYTNLQVNQHVAVRQQILTTIQQLGYLKWLNDQNNLEMNFDPGFIDLLSFANSTMNLAQYISRVIAKSVNPQNIDADYILREIEQLQQLQPNLFQLCNGHDFLKAFSIYLRNVHRANDASEKGIASACRIAYTHNYYQTSTLYKNTKLWADTHNCVIY